MTKVRRGGYVFLTRLSDHPPRHVHVYAKERLVLKWDLEESREIWGTPAPALLDIIRDLQREGRL